MWYNGCADPDPIIIKNIIRKGVFDYGTLEHEKQENIRGFFRPLHRRMSFPGAGAISFVC
jgi:hypothetical protein